MVGEPIPTRTLPRSVATPRRRTLLAVVALGVSLGTLALLALAAGWKTSAHHLEHARWPLLAAAVGSHLLANVAYAVAYHRALNLRPGPSLSWGHAAVALLVGFGALPGRGGSAVDRAALMSLGSTRDDAVTWSTVGVLVELAILALAAWVCALLLIGAPGVPYTESTPWAVLVPLLAPPALIAARRACQGPAEPVRARAWIQQSVRAIARTIELTRHPRMGGPIFLGVALYSAADVCALAIALRLCHLHLAVDRLILAYATGYLLTRRALPLAGAGVSDALLCLALSWVGLPLAGAVPAVLVYRTSDLAVTLPLALATNAAFIRLAELATHTPPSSLRRG